MDFFWNVLGFFGAMFVLVLAVIGAVSTAIALSGGDRRAAIQRAQQAEEQIAEIGRRAQAAILDEALRRSAARHDPGRTPRHGHFVFPDTQSGDDLR